MALTNPDKIRKICVIQLQPFGDVFLCTSYLEAVQRKYKNAKITFLVKAPFQMALRDHPAIDSVQVIQNKKGIGYGIERLRSWLWMFFQRFDMVLDYANMPSTQMLVFWSAAPYRVGYQSERKNMDWVYNIKAISAPGRYSAVQKIDLLKPLGMDERDQWKLTFPLHDEERTFAQNWFEKQKDPENVVFLAPVSKTWHKQWHYEGWVTVADTLSKEHGYTVAFIGAPPEQEQMQEIAQQCSEPIEVFPPMELGQSLALIEKAKVLVCHDGALNHLAVSTETPTLGLFASSNSERWSPASAVESYRHIDNGNRDREDRTMKITAEEVISETLNMIRNS